MANRDGAGVGSAEQRRFGLWRMPIRLPVRPSPRLSLLRRIGCGISLSSLLHTHPVCLLLLLPVVTGKKHFRSTPVSVILETGGRWWLVHGDDRYEQAGLSSGCHAHPSFIVLSLVGVRGCRVRLTLLPDSMPADDLRRLRARLRLDSRVWKWPGAIDVRHRNKMRIRLTPIQKTVLQISTLTFLSLIAVTL